jgi:4-hydroxybenzoate polyprenyltransferase
MHDISLPGALPMAIAAAASAAPFERLRTYASFVRFEHTLFSLPLLLAGIFSAPGPSLSWARWALILVAAVGARTTALAINRLVDRRLDALNPRTAGRELPAQRMKVAEAWALLLASGAAYLAACAALGPWYVRVSCVPLLVFVGYPYLKRVTPLCHFGVGLGLALAPLAGYAAAHPDLGAPSAALWLAGFALAWVSGFDIIYATLDEAFDRAHGVRSLVVALGRRRALHLSAALHMVAMLCALAAFNTMKAPDATLITRAPGLALFAVLGLLLYLEQKWADDVNLAFFKVNVVVGFGLLAMVLATRAPAGF